MKMQEDYYLGLDMGTSSVGWAVTDKSYNILRVKGKELWGVRLFKEAETSQARRTARIARRRRQREIARIGLLRELFAEEINKIDSSFFQRLDESKYHPEDKRENTKYGLFADRLFTDKEYFKKYPTIFHLRKELVEDSNPHDVRLVYLAILNIFKHRGHFLNAALGDEIESNFEIVYEELKALLSENLDIHFNTGTTAGKLEEILGAKGLSRTKLAEKAAEVLGVKKTKDKKAYEVIKSLCGLTFSLETIFGESDMVAEQKVPTLSFRDESFVENIVMIEDLIGEDNSEILGLLKTLHDQALLSNIMSGFNYLSQARVNKYEKHKEDLRLLKKTIKELAPDQYDILFRSDADGTYSAYVGSSNADKKQRRGYKKRKPEDLYSTIKKIFKDAPKDHFGVEYILEEIESGNFLPKQLTSENGVIPNQLHFSELQAILRNAQNYLPFLSVAEEGEVTNAEKIAQLFRFQIPYYVGPLNDYHKDKGGNAWVVRKKPGKVLPWNFDDMIDCKQSSQEFIERLIRKCTYIKNEPVLPKSSLLYEKYMVLNELNNLKVRGERIDVSLKQDIYNELFLTGKRVTQKKLENYLMSKCILAPDEKGVISGIDGDFKSSLASYGKFLGVFGDEIKKEANRKMIEQIIFWGTVYSDDKCYLKENMIEQYGQVLSDDQINRIAGFKFNDWGRLSREFLEMPGVNKETGEALPLIQMLWSYNENLMELMSERFTFADKLKEGYGLIAKAFTELEYSDLGDLYLSSPVKRMIWQTVLIVKELEEILGGPPKRVFVEMAREPGEKGKRTKSRKEKLLELYKNCREDVASWTSELEKRTDSELRSKKLYLYYAQRGRCMYTGESIHIGQLFDDNLYDIDHIYPQKVVKDDSLDNNLVLVKKQANAEKSNRYPVDESIYKKQHNFWKSLLSADMKDGFITREKYNRLVNRSPLTEEQLAGFISRQLVETRQGTKVVTQVLEQSFANSEIIFVKARNVSDFRHDYELLKARSLNDFHHAQDAYFSIVVGNAYYVKFTKNPINFIGKRDSGANSDYHLGKMFSSTIKRGSDIGWIHENSTDCTNSISIVKRQASKTSPMVTKMTYEGHGELFNATLYGAKKASNDSYIPLKSSDSRIHDVSKYGGYSSVSTAHFFLVEHEVKGKKIRTLEALPLIYRCTIGDDVEKLKEYCQFQLNLTNPDIRLAKIKLQSLIKKDGFYLNITGKTGNQILVSNAVAMILEDKWTFYIKKIENTLENQYIDKDISKEKNEELFSELLRKHTTSIYKCRPNPIEKTLGQGQEKFQALEEKEQCFILAQILQLSQLSNMGSNLELIDGSKKSGVSLISKKISDSNEFILINQSITGVYRNKIDLLTV